MNWATAWSWTYSTASWCFFIAAVGFVIYWWVGFRMHAAKLEFVEKKIDALLDEFDVDFDGHCGKRCRGSCARREEGRQWRPT